MTTPTRSLCRSNKAQINFLCQYMALNPDFAAGDYRCPQGARSLKEEWQRLKEALDEIGPEKTVQQWKVCWRDQKLRARKEGASRSQATRATGNFPVPDLTENAMLILSTIGPEMAAGIGPEESPIGFAPTSGETSPVPLPPQDSPCPKKKRARNSLPPERFLAAQLELNELMKELLAEVRRSNELREEHLKYLRPT